MITKNLIVTNREGIITKKIQCDDWRSVVGTDWVATGRENSGTLARSTDGDEIGACSTATYYSLNIGDVL